MLVIFVTNFLQITSCLRYAIVLNARLLRMGPAVLNRGDGAGVAASELA